MRQYRDFISDKTLVGPFDSNLTGIYDNTGIN